MEQAKLVLCLAVFASSGVSAWVGTLPPTDLNNHAVLGQRGVTWEEDGIGWWAHALTDTELSIFWEDVANVTVTLVASFQVDAAAIGAHASLLALIHICKWKNSDATKENTDVAEREASGCERLFSKSGVVGLTSAEGAIWWQAVAISADALVRARQIVTLAIQTDAAILITLINICKYRQLLLVWLGNFSQHQTNLYCAVWLKLLSVSLFFKVTYINVWCYFSPSAWNLHGFCVALNSLWPSQGQNHTHHNVLWPTYADLLVWGLFIAWQTGTLVWAIHVGAHSIGTHSSCLTLIHIWPPTNQHIFLHKQTLAWGHGTAMHGV